MDLGLIEFLKVVRYGMLVDEETMSSPKSIAPIEGTHGQDGKTKGSESNVPKP